MEFEKPSNTTPLSEVDGTVIIPQTDCDYPSKLLDSYMSQPDYRGGSVAVSKSLLIENDQDEGVAYELNIESLAQLIWEHQQYSRAQKFSVSDMEVLRAIQLEAQKQQRVFSSDLSNYVDYEDPTISQAITRLEERNLVKREKRGVVRYKGFDAWTAPAPEDE